MPRYDLTWREETGDHEQVVGNKEQPGLSHPMWQVPQLTANGRGFSDDEFHGNRNEKNTHPPFVPKNSISQVVQPDANLTSLLSQHLDHEWLMEYDDDELSPLEYAQRYGLTTSGSRRLFVHATSPLPPLDAVTQDLEDLDDLSDLRGLITPESREEIRVPERWTVEKATASVLAAVVSLKQESIDIDPEGIESLPRMKHLKVEEPLLPTDPGLDVWRLKNRNRTTISAKGMVPFKLSDRKGESFAWSTSEIAAHAQAESIVCIEKLDVDMEVVRYLRDIQHFASHRDEDPEALARVDCPVRTLKPSTPPLLPLSPLPSSPRPSSAAMDMEYTSTPDDLTKEEAESLERHIMQEDEITSYTPLYTPQTSSSSPLHDKTIRNLKAEVPLMLNDTIHAAPKRTKTVSFPVELQTLIADTRFDAGVLPSEPDSASSSSLTNAVKPLAESAFRQIEQERLSEIDTTMRIAVPKVDEVALAAPWKIPGPDERPVVRQRPTLQQALDLLADGEQLCKGLSKVERLLSWTPFPARLGKVVLDGSIDDGSSARYMAEIDPGLTVEMEDLVWKPNGLRILDEREDDEDELEGYFAPPCNNHTTMSAEDRRTGTLQLPARKSSVRAELTPAQTRSATIDMQALLRKRKLELEGEMEAMARPSKLPSYTVTDGRQVKASERTAVEPGGLLDTGGLASFMHLHGQPIAVSAQPENQALPTPQPLAPPANMLQLPKSLNQASTSQSLTLVPEVIAPEKPRSVVLSTDLAKNRQLVTSISHRLATLDLIERDPISSINTDSQPPSKQPDQREADVTISPSTGLVLTTLQKLKQRPLPGQTNFVGIAERIRHVAICYERLVVLVSQGHQQSSTDDTPWDQVIDGSDLEALSDLIALGTTVSTEVEVYHIPGGDQELALWIAAFISRHTPSDGESKLLAEETQWERLLRHAGMNAYAAQTILYHLKRTEATDEDSSSPSYGLNAFVQMTAEQRVERFGRLMGGDRVLRRVNNIIDGHWPSVSKAML